MIPTPFFIDSLKTKMFYNSKHLFDFNQTFYYGCKSKPKSIIIKKKIPPSEYVYANLKLNEWNLSTADCKKSQLLISKEWVDTHFFKKTEPDVVPVLPDELPDTETVDAPALLILEDNEKFKDTDGNILDIETRGTKSRKNIYFKISDVSKGFDMKNLNTTLSHKEGGYEKNIDYKVFFIRDRLPNEQSPTIKKCLYLTYHGLLRVLFVSRNKNVEIFQDWAEESLFTIQMGTKEDKVKLGTSILNISPKTYKAVFSTYANKFPCIYLLSLGTVKDLRDTFGIDASTPDDYIVYKYGFTDDLQRRIGEHETKYNKLPNVNVKLATFNIIDPIYMKDAERDIREECNAYEVSLKSDGYNELIVLNEKQLKHTKQHYSRIGREYAGHTAELQDQIVKLKDDIKTYEFKIQLNTIKYDNEIQKYKTIIETNEIINNLKFQNYELQIKNLSFTHI
jgi:hypothetical protein